MRGRFFSVCGSPVTCFAVTRETRVLKKSASGVPVGINSSPIRVRFFQYAEAFFSGYTGKKRTPAGRPIKYRQNRDRFFQYEPPERFFQVILKKRISYETFFFSIT